MKNQPSTPMRLLQITDTHCYADDDSRLEWSTLKVYPNRSLIRLLAHLQTSSADYDALIISGDLAQEETAETYQRLRKILQGFPLPVYILPGNHDVPELMYSELAMGSEHIHYLPDAVFSDWHVLFLDTHQTGHPEGHLSDQQFAALKIQLDNVAPEEHILLFMHHHPVPIGSPLMDGIGLQETDTFWSLLTAYPQVKAVVFGHIHSEFSTKYPVTAKRDILVFGTPATCVQAKHIDEKLRLDHDRPAWRELVLYADGRLETAVHYLQS